MVINKRLHIITIWLIIITLLTTMMTPINRVHALVEGDYEYSVNRDDTETVTITSYRGYLDGWSVKDLVIPSRLAGKKVTGIGQNAFRGNEINSVVIPDSVTIIEGQAFWESQITSVQ